MIAGLTLPLLLLPFVGIVSAPAVAATDTNPSFYVNANDLDHILRQIQIAESHAAGNDLLCATPTDTSGKCVPSPKLPFGLRTVDGSHNNLVAGRSTWGASDQAFPRLLEPTYAQAQPAPPFSPPAGDTSVCTPSSATCYAQWQPGHFVYDSTPRLVSNLIVDQTTSNPAAVNAATHLPGSEVRPDGTVFLPNMAPDEGLSAPTNAFFTFFGQFFDHGLDLVDKGGNGTLVVPIAMDDPLRDRPDFNPQAPFLMLTRATRLPGPDGVVGTVDDVHNNETTSFVDQNQTYTSHPSHQVFLREYALVDGAPSDTGHLLDGTLPGGGRGGLATWTDVKAQARTVLGIDLSDADALDVPQIVSDPYGNFVPGPNGFPLLVTDPGSGVVTVEGDPSAPVSTTDALGTGHSFLEDIAHGATPILVDGELQPAFDDEGNPILDPETGEPVITGYDNVTLGEHFVTGDGRGNENIGLTSVHHVFHSEHNRLVDQIEQTLAENPELEKAYRGQAHQWPNLRPEQVLPGPEDDDWSFDQRVFQAARFVNEMEYQHLVFEEFGRTIQPSIDEVVFNENSYNADVNPSVAAEFAHVVYRFGHSMLTEEIARSGFGTQDVSLLEGFLDPRVYDDDGALTPDQAAGSIVNGTVDQVSSQIDEFVVDTLRNNLLGLPLDLASINILRGRDTGTPPLQEARRSFFAATGDAALRPYESWVDFGNNLKNGNIFGRDDTSSSLVNFVASYGQHPSVLTASTVEAKREAANLLVNGAPAGTAFLSRIAGITRGDTAALISRTQFDAPVPVVYLTTGYNFPDALAAGSLAARDGGPILLVGQNFIPFETLVELGRLQPERIVILGSDVAVAASVQQELQQLAIAPVERLGGVTRYDTAAMISQRLQPTAGAADTVYVATGLNFPDSLAASAIAARDGDPILLTATTSLPEPTRAELVRLDPDRIVVLGGSAAISDGVLASIEQARPAADVVRVGGTTRYDTAVQLTQQAFPDPVGTLYITTGVNFPDGLAVGPVAGLNGSSVLMVPPTGPIPPVVMDEIARMSPERIVVLGSTLAVADDIDPQLSVFTPSPVPVPDDRIDFMFSTGPWANSAPGTTTTGVDTVDFWSGGLAERVNPFGGMLGTSFNFVFEETMESLQFGDRFYYLFRNQGNQLFAALEANSFSALIERNTDASNLPANIFSIQDPTIELEGIAEPFPGGLRREPDGTYRWRGDEHVEFHGTGDTDRIRADEGDDAIWGKAGQDFLEGGAGNDTIVGGSGNDVITDSFGDDTLKGGWGNDAIHAGPGFDVNHGGPGHDFIVNGGDPDVNFLGDGDDVTLGTTGRQTVFGGEGADWVEGSRHADLLQGDNANQFQNDVIGGNDVVVGRGGDDDVEGEGGDDVLVGSWFGTDRHLGNMGYDWITYYGETADVDADLFFTVLQRPDVTAVRDRYDQLEAVSGGSGDDTIRGLGREPDGTEGVDPLLHRMTESTLDMTTGLREMLQPPGHDNYALRFMATGPVVDSDGISNLLVGGPGSDVIEGRTGDDFIDGDAMLRVRLARVTPGTEDVVEHQDSAAGYSDRIFRGEIDPGDLRIDRDIAYLGGGGETDTAVYTFPIAEYEIEDLGDGYHRVTHTPVVGEAEEAEGADVVRNVEILQFADNCLDLRTGLTCDPVAQLALSTDDPAEDVPLTASLLTPEGEPFDTAAITGLTYTWWTGEGGGPGDITESEHLVGPTGATYTPTDEAVGSYLQARATFTDASGLPQVVTSPWTANPVLSVNDPPAIPALVTPGGTVVGQNVQAAPPTDGDGVETASEAGWVYAFESAADAGFTTDVQALAAVGSSYTLTSADVGRYVRVTVAYTDDLGTAETAVTAVIGPVTSP